MKKILLLLMFGLGLTFSKAQTPITVDDTQTVQQLIEDVLILGACAEVNNVVSPNNSTVGGDSFQSFGSFDGTGASPAFPFDSGIVLATNGVNMIPTGVPGQSGGGGWAGDPDLEALINEPGNSNNATVIEFDFIPFVDEISFNYFLASDEWPTFVCNFADTFAFILSGPGISNVNSYNHDANPNTPELSLDLGGLNIATIPGTTIPVNPTNIHDLSNGCFPGNLGEFAVPQLYDGAALNDGTTFYNGRTVALTASAQVIPGQTYTIKLAIADRGDTIFNSAVFIESASFDLGGIDLGPDITIINGNAPCEGDTITLDAGFSATNIQYFWAKDGAIIPGENNQTLDVTESGVYEVGIQIGAGGTACFGVSNAVTVEFYPEPEFDLTAPIDLCAGDSVILDGTPTNASAYTSLDYQWSKDGTDLAGETNATLSVTEGGTYEVVVDANACEDATTSFTVNLIDYQVALDDLSNNCVEQGSVFQISPAFTNLTQDEIDNEVSYLWSTGETTPTIELSGADTTVSLTTTFKGCDETATETFTFFNTPEVSITGGVVVCQGDTNTLDATPSNVSDLTSPTYTWSKDGVEITGENNPTLDITEGGTYEVVVDNNGCSQSSNVDVELVNYQVSIPAAVDPCVGSGETVVLSAGFTGLTQEEIDNEVTYEWTTDNGTETTPSIALATGGTVSLTTTFKGCQESVTETFTFFTNPAVDIAGMDVICQGDTNTLDATPMNLNDLVSPTYSWTLNGDPVAGDTPVLDITEGGTYEITVDNNGCAVTDTFDVESVNLNVSFENENISIIECTSGGGTTNVVLEPIISGLTPAQENQIFYNWSDGSTGETLTVSESGDYSVEVNVDGNCVQSSSVQVSITLIETIQATLADDLKCPGDEVTILPILSSDVPGLIYQWSKDGNILPNETGPSLTVTEEGEYTLVVDNQGCLSNTASATISNYEVDNCVITQGISPDFNTDGKNDCMDLTWLSDESGIRKMTVFNRYGRKVFEENNYVNTFCGQDDNGDELSTGTYFYVIELERESTKLRDGLVVKGWVYLNAEQ